MDRTERADVSRPGERRAYDGTSPLYGTTIFGGANGLGIAFSLTPHRKSWKQKVIHDFCTPDCLTDGQMPEAELTMDASGNLFGTTNGGGDANNGGTVFELEPKRKGTFAETILHRFCETASGTVRALGKACTLL